MTKTLTEFLGVTRNPQEISRETGIRLSVVREKMLELMDYLPGWGRPELHRWIISRKKYDWPASDLACIQEHRRLHDQGRVTMCQGRDKEYTILYAIPTSRIVRRNPYFYGAPA